MFRIYPDGTGYTNLHTFTTAAGSGKYPSAGLVLAGNTLYGTTQWGGSGANGTVFKISTDGTGFTNIHDFTGSSDGARPVAALAVSTNFLYGTTFGGGTTGNGTVFRVKTDGTGFTNLHNFTAGSDGGFPLAELVLSGNTLYGTRNMGSHGNGTVFKINTDGTGFTSIRSFSTTSGSAGTNSDGALPVTGLVLSGNTLYGTTVHGGTAGNGTLFRLNTSGSSFTNLHSFTATVTAYGINSDGAMPHGGLVLAGNTLYGTTEFGGNEGAGVVFEVKNDGTGFTNLHSFHWMVSNKNTDGAQPAASLVLAGSTLYGTTSHGGSGSYGTLFAFNLPTSPIPLNIRLTNGALNLSWSNPTFSLQAAPAVTGTYTNIPGALSPYTNSITGSRRFRLKSN